MLNLRGMKYDLTLCFNLQYVMFGSDNGLASNIRTNDGLVCWRIYASLRLNELKYFEHIWVGQTVDIDHSSRLSTALPTIDWGWFVLIHTS